MILGLARSLLAGDVDALPATLDACQEWLDHAPDAERCKAGLVASIRQDKARGFGTAPQLQHLLDKLRDLGYGDAVDEYLKPAEPEPIGPMRRLGQTMAERMNQIFWDRFLDLDQPAPEPEPPVGRFVICRPSDLGRAVSVMNSINSDLVSPAPPQPTINLTGVNLRDDIIDSVVRECTRPITTIATPGVILAQPNTDEPYTVDQGPFINGSDSYIRELADSLPTVTVNVSGRLRR
jgi:hypothetical protein